MKTTLHWAIRAATAVTSALFILSACDKHSNEAGIKYETAGLVSEINISNVTIEWSDIKDIAFVARFHGFGSGSTLNADGEDTRVMLKVPFNADGTTLTLPANPPKELLRDIASDFPEGFTISDPEAKTIANVEIACNMSGNRFYQFIYKHMEFEGVHYKLSYIYCDRSATVTGTGQDWWGHAAYYNLSLKKGWNTIIEKREYKEDGQSSTVTHMMPSGMKWEQNMWI